MSSLVSFAVPFSCHQATELNTSQPEEEKTSDTLVFITIEDVDDNEPTFDSESVTATIAENSPSGSPLNMELIVTDDDTVSDLIHVKFETWN